MTQIEMRKAKAELHKSIVDIIVSFNPNDTEMDALWDYVKNLAEIEKSIDKFHQVCYTLDTKTKEMLKMIAWYWPVVAFIGGIVFATMTWEVCDYTNWLSSLLAGLTLVIVFIPCMFYQIFIKHIIFPVPENKWEFLTTSKAFEDRKKYHLFKNFYFWYSPNGSFHDKFFFVRVKKSKVKKE